MMLTLYTLILLLAENVLFRPNKQTKIDKAKEKGIYYK